MPNRSLSYKVEFDTRTAVRDLQRLTREGKRAGEEIADGFDSTETAGTNALRALTRQLDTLEQTAAGTARAAEAIGRQMSDGYDPTRIQGFVADLNRIGVTFDEIEGKADEFAAVLRRADDTDLAGVRGELDQVDAGLEKVRSNSDQSRSVLANLAGNSAQSLGELGGVVGDLGVGVGQLVEYAVDGNIALANLAKVAGPMAGLAAAGLLVNAAFGKVSEASKANADRLDLFTDAARDGTDAMAALEEQVRETGQLEFTPTGFLAGARDLLPIFDQLGIDWQEFQQLIADDTAVEHLKALRDEAGRFTQLGGLYTAAIEGVEDYRGSIDDAAEAQARLEDFIGPRVPPSLSEINAELVGQSVALDRINQLWGEVIADLADDGVIDSARTAFDGLQQMLGLSNAELAELALQKTDEHLADVADQAETAAAALDEARRTIRDINAEPLDVAGGLADLFDIGDQTVDFQAAKAAVDDAIAALDEAIAASGGVDWSALLDVGALDPSAIDAELVGAVQGARDALQEGIGAAFELGGADAAQHFLDTFVPRLVEAGGLTESEVLQLLGLPADGSIDAALQPYVDASKADQARRILDALAGVDAERVAPIRVALETGQLQGEQAALVAQLAAFQLGVGVFPQVDETTTEAEIQAAQAWLNDHPVTADVEADTDPAESQLRGFTARRRSTTVDADADTKVADRDLADVARPRTAPIDTAPVAQLIQALLVNAFLDHAARPRTVSIGVEVSGLATANQLLDYAARDRTTTINVDAETFALQRAIATAISNAVRLGRIAS